MRNVLTILLLVLASAALLTSCERKHAVQAAGPETDTYQPIPADDPGLKPGDEIRGEVEKVDIGNKIMIIRLDNGMEQTMRLNDSTRIESITMDPNGIPLTLKQLSGQTGADVRIQWTETDGTKIADTIQLTNDAPRQWKLKKRKH